MRAALFLWTLFFFCATTSCDSAICLDFYVQNNCSEQIIVSATMGMWESERQSSINTIKPNTKAHIHQETSVLGFTRGSIFVTVQEMKITKDDKDISIHPSDTSKWDFAYTGKGYEATLTVSPEDFRRR